MKYNSYLFRNSINYFGNDNQLTLIDDVTNSLKKI